MKSEWRLFGEKLWFQAIKMTYPKTKLPPITCRGDQKWTKIRPQKPKIGSNWTLLGALKATPKRRWFERFLTLIPKVGPKLTQKWSKEVKNDQNWVKFGFRGQGWGFLGKKGRSAHQKWAKGHFRGLKIGFDKDFWQEVRPIAGNPEFPGLVWKGWRGKFGRMIFCYKNEKSVWKFLMNEIGKNENNVIFFVTNEKYGNYFDSSLRWPILTDLSLVSLKSLMNEF